MANHLVIFWAKYEFKMAQLYHVDLADLHPPTRESDTLATKKSVRNASAFKIHAIHFESIKTISFPYLLVPNPDECGLQKLEEYGNIYSIKKSETFDPT